MKKAVKLLAVTLALVLTLSVAFAGCGQDTASSSAPSSSSGASSSSSSSSTADSTPSEDPPEVKDVVVQVFTYTEIPDDSAAMEAINEIMHPLGVNVVFEWTTSKLMWEQLPLKISTGERVDLAPLSDYRLAGYVQNGSLMAIDDLFEEYGGDIVTAFGDDCSWVLDATVLSDGHRYSVPTLDAKFNEIFCILNADIIDKYSLDISSVKSYKDLTPIFETVHEKEPSMKVIIPATSSIACTPGRLLGCDDYENLTDTLGVLMEDDEKLVNLYKSDAYADVCTTLYEWSQAGFISEDIVSSKENVDSLWKTGNSFACFRVSTNLDAADHANGTTVQYGVNSAAISLGQKKNVFLRYQQCLPITNGNPEGTMIFLNEMYKNADLVNSIYYGKKGTDWELDSNECIEFKEDAGYPVNQAFVQHFGNYFLSTDRSTNYKGYVNDSFTKMQESPSFRALGFVFDSSSVAAQYTACQNVVSEYNGLEYGTMDPAVELPNFIAKLDASGIDDIIAEKQKQFDAWRASKGK